jgi:hypothetical protein
LLAIVLQNADLLELVLLLDTKRADAGRIWLFGGILRVVRRRIICQGPRTRRTGRGAIPLKWMMDNNCRLSA